MVPETARAEARATTSGKAEQGGKPVDAKASARGYGLPNGVERRDTGTNGRRGSDYNPQWCNERYTNIERRIAELWGEEHGGIKALWKKIDGINQKLWAIIMGQLAILSGLVVALAKQAWF